MGETLRVALIGAGFVARDHAAAWHAQPGAEVRCVVDADPDRARSLAAEFGVEHRDTDFGSLVGHPGIDAVDICLPPRLHLESTCAFLAAGQHVLLEKPFVTGLEDAARMLEAEQHSAATLMVAENWPFASATRRVRRLVDDGALGELFMLRAQNESALYVEHDGEVAAALRLSAAGGGFTMTAGVHNITLASLLMGGIESVFAYSTERPASPEPFLDRDVVISARFGNGGIGGMFFTGRSLHVGGRRLAFGLTGTRGTAEFDILSGSVTYTVDGERTSIEQDQPSMGFAEEIAHFCECIVDGRTPLTAARRQLESLAAVLAVYRSLYDGREVRPADLLAQADLATAVAGAGGGVDG
ncbi:putative dehydrogenase [Haloactinopolyspora alba]|uniref:Putative dehydrogenase n=1 Tax=Haloactinopolyspora alba TaxID=648780 RepID=A0A2P8E756_9ACTN|nr:Gfo/Idh/MocA family oxidoreductase [Haloactinopolyspora alba]PSL05268.1 putative dehydrogenase [Haloactinopolyspora alba]